MLNIKRIVVNEYGQVQEIEFYEGARPDEIVAFCNKFKIARNTFKDELITPIYTGGVDVKVNGEKVNPL